MRQRAETSADPGLALRVKETVGQRISTMGKLPFSVAIMGQLLRSKYEMTLEWGRLLLHAQSISGRAEEEHGSVGNVWNSVSG